MALAPSRSSLSIVAVSVFAASVTSIAAVALVVAFGSAASVISVACVTSLFFDPIIASFSPIEPSPLAKACNAR